MQAKITKNAYPLIPANELSPEPSLRVIKIKTPMKAITNPKAFLLVILDLKNKAPIITTNKGVNAFKTPVKELLSLVWAVGNRNAGIKLPKSPIKIRF